MARDSDPHSIRTRAQVSCFPGWNFLRLTKEQVVNKALLLRWWAEGEEL